MKALPALLAAHYGLPNTTLATFLEIVRRDGHALRVTTVDIDVSVDGHTYLGAPGLDLTNVEVSAGSAVDRLELQIFPDDDQRLEADLLAGRWNFARFRLFEANYLAPADGMNVFRRGWTGEAQARVGRFTIELRSLKQTLQQPIGAVTQKTCRHDFGDAGCKMDADAWTFTYEVDAVASRREFTVVGIEPDDFYKEGKATALTGQNAGYAQKIRASAAGVITLALPFPFDLLPGDQVALQVGDQKRLIEDCKEKFDNVLNFDGESHLPGPDALLADPDRSA